MPKRKEKKIPPKIYAILKGDIRQLDTLSADRPYRLRIFKEKRRAEYFIEEFGSINDSVYVYHSNEDYNRLLLEKCRLEKELDKAQKELLGLKTTVKNLQRDKSIRFDNL